MVRTSCSRLGRYLLVEGYTLRGCRFAYATFGGPRARSWSIRIPRAAKEEKPSQVGNRSSESNTVGQFRERASKNKGECIAVNFRVKKVKSACSHSGVSCSFIL
jgi:hypothetical protein